MKTFSSISTFSDDGLPCISFKLKRKRFSLMWTSRRIADDMKNYDKSEKAQRKLKRVVNICNDWIAGRDEDDDRRGRELRGEMASEPWYFSPLGPVNLE